MGTAQPTGVSRRRASAWVIDEDEDDDRVSIRFDDIPAADVRSRLKAHGFRWSPTRRLWVRTLSNGGRYAARSVLRLA